MTLKERGSWGISSLCSRKGDSGAMTDDDASAQVYPWICLANMIFNLMAKSKVPLGT